MEKTVFLFLFILFTCLPAWTQKTKMVREVIKAPAAARIPAVSAARVQALAFPRLTPLSAQTLFTRITPAWKEPLSPKFTPEHLRTVEDALLRTDAFLFTEEYGRPAARSGEWNYSELFSRELASLLKERGQTLSPSQWKQIFGGTGVKGFTLSNHLRLLTLDSWLLTHGGEFPRRQFSVNGRVLKPGELSPEQKEEQKLANGIKWAVLHAKDTTDPVLLHLKFRYEQGTRKKTPEYWLEELNLWLLEHNGEYPRSSFSNGTRIAAADLTPAQKREAALANAVNNAIKLAKDPSDPVIARLIQLKEEGRRYNTPEQTLALLEEWSAAHGGRMPRASIVKNGRYLSASELTPEEAEEKRLASIARALTQNAASEQNQAVQRIKTLFQNASRRKTAGQILEELQIWMDAHQGCLPRLQAPKGEALSDELKEEISLGRAALNQIYRARLASTPQAEQIRTLWQSGQARVTRRTPEEWLQAFKTYLGEYKRYPMRGTPEYAGVRNLLYRSAKNPDGSYVTPVVQQIYELDQLARAARRGEAAWKDVTAETGADAPLKRFWRDAAPQDRESLQATAEEMDYMRDDFADWLTDAVQNDWLVLASQTYKALANVRRGLDEWFDERADEAEDILVWLYDTQWGRDEENGIFSRVLFTGANPAAPRLKDFREVQEFTGVPVTQVPKMPSSVAAHTRLTRGDEARVLSLRLLRGARPEDLHRAIESLLPENGGFTVRAGLHELGVSVTEMEVNKHFTKGLLHVHAEAEVPGEPVVLSFTLEIDARNLAAGKQFPELKRLYYNLFKPYLSEDAKRFLR